MGTIKGYLLVGLGALLTFGGAFWAFASIGHLDVVLWWGLVAVLGVYVLGVGIEGVVAAEEGTAEANPEKSVTKTDSRFGAR